MLNQQNKYFQLFINKKRTPMPQQQETIPLTRTSGNSSYGSTAENTATNSASNENPDTIETKVYANSFKQKFRQDFPMAS